MYFGRQKYGNVKIFEGEEYEEKKIAVIKRINYFLELAVQLSRIAKSDKRSWEKKYEVIFPALSDRIRATGINFEWQDPDAGYQADVEAYVQAVKRKAAEIKIRKTTKIGLLEMVNEMSGG